LIAPHNSSVVTRMIPSTYRRQRSKVLPADGAHRHPVGEDPHRIQRNAPPRLDGLVHGIAVDRLDTDHLDFRAEFFQVAGHSGDQPAAAHRHEDGIQLAGALAQQLVGDRALTGNDQFVIEGVDVGHAGRFGQLPAAVGRFRVIVPVQNHLCAQGLDRLKLDLRGGRRHHDHGLEAQLPGGKGDPLGMVAGRRGDHPVLFLDLREMGNPVVGAAQLEGKNRLQVFALEQNAVVQLA
jgi:hypothetical protein